LPGGFFLPRFFSIARYERIDGENGGQQQISWARHVLPWQLHRFTMF
jgi:hypothetical protein